ncbi:thioredoxin family protein [Tenacibaculum sp. TC6]|uniref:thioredoxin family protein n=1 Tax=Tenacibaculum sp. TC6 TaxID=3423223 RepID=UPI003D36A52E
MKKISVFFLFLLIIQVSYSQEMIVNTEDIQVNWEPSYEQAIQKAKEENKPVLIYFSGSDWCGPCIKLDKELFHTQKFTEYANENLILYLADFPRNKDLVTKEANINNKKLAKKYKNSFPMVILIDKKEKVLGEKRGSYMTEYYYTFFDTVLKKFYK